MDQRLKYFVLLCFALSLLGANGANREADRTLGGTSWQLVRFQGSDDKILTPDDKSKYTIAFGTDGRLDLLREVIHKEQVAKELLNR
jgi:hypothetical protein